MKILFYGAGVLGSSTQLAVKKPATTFPSWRGDAAWPTCVFTASYWKRPQPTHAPPRLYTLLTRWRRTTPTTGSWCWCARTNSKFDERPGVTSR